MISPHRPAEKKALDEGDFISMVAQNYEVIDLALLFSLGEMIKANGGVEIQRFVEQAKAGQRLVPQVTLFFCRGVTNSATIRE